MENLKERFLKTYANIPLGSRDEIIVIIDGRPISWDAAFVEVKGEGAKAPEILEKLDKMKLIK